MSDTTTAITLSGAFLMGLASSGHCLAMCGALTGAFGMRARHAAPDDGSALRAALLYQLGRIGSYAAAGAVCGGLGATLQAVLDVTRLTVTLRVLAGMVLILAGIRLLSRWNAFVWLERAGATLWRRLQPAARRAATHEGARGALLLGMLWGWLPCGLTYSMLLFAALTTQPVSGAAVMMAFGLGTLPAMLTSTLLAAEVQRWLARRSLRIASAALLIVCGIWLAAASVPGRHEHHDHSAGRIQPLPSADVDRINRMDRMRENSALHPLFSNHPVTPVYPVNNLNPKRRDGLKGLGPKP